MGVIQNEMLLKDGKTWITNRGYFVFEKTMVTENYREKKKLTDRIYFQTRRVAARTNL